MRRIQTEAKEPKIGVAVDLHGNLYAARKIALEFKQENVDCIVLPGDIPDFTKQNLRLMIRAFLKVKVPVIIFGGSHENSQTYNAVLKEFKEDKLVIDAMHKTNQRIKLGEYELLMIPGSGSISSGSKAYNGGNMWLIEEHKTKKLIKELNEKIKMIRFAKIAAPVFMEDIEKNFSKKTVTGSGCIVFTHNPPLCTTKKGIDLARFGKPTKEFFIQPKHLKLKLFKELGFRTERIYGLGNVTSLVHAQTLKKYGYPIKVLTKNVGSEKITTLLKKERITKLVCGHIHEAGAKAIDKHEKIVRQKTPSKELFINSGEGVKGKSTILTLHKKGKVSHRFLHE